MSTFNELIDFTRSTTGTYLDSVVYGDELVTNGTFATDSDWNKGTGWTISNDTASCDGAQSGYTSLDQALSLSNTSEYLIKFNATVSAGILFIRFGTSSSAGNLTTISADGLYTFVTPTLGGLANIIKFFGDPSFVGSVDNVSVKEVIGGQVSGTPLLRTAAINEPRLEYDAQGNALGLLIEEARTNKATYSQDLTHSSWNKAEVTVAAAPIAAPDGTMTANHVVKTGSNGHLSKNAIGNTSDRVSVWARTVSGTGTMYMGYHNASHEVTVTEEWQQLDAQLNNANAYVANFRGDATLTEVYLWGAQVETGAFPTSYIPTTGSTVTRTADVASLPVERFAYNQSKGSLVVYANAPDGSNQNRLTQLVTNGGSSNRVVDLHRVINSISMYNGTSTLTGGTFDASNDIKAAGVYKSGSYALVSDGGSTVTNSDTTVNTPDTLMLGANGSSARQLNGHIKQIQYYPKRLSNTELQLLTQPSASPTMNLTFDGQATSTLVEGLHD